METKFNGQPNREDSGGEQENNRVDDQLAQANAAAEAADAENKRKRHQENHHINRKYKLFSNHSSYGDSPHTNTSF